MVLRLVPVGWVQHPKVSQDGVRIKPDAPARDGCGDFVENGRCKRQ
jgi:hypothetical protein